MHLPENILYSKQTRGYPISPHFNIIAVASVWPEILEQQRCCTWENSKNRLNLGVRYAPLFAHNKSYLYHASLKNIKYIHQDCFTYFKLIFNNLNWMLSGTVSSIRIERNKKSNTQMFTKQAWHGWTSSRKNHF